MERLTYEDRKLIERLLKKKLSKRGIGRALNRVHSVVIYEIKNHSSPFLDYNADRAQGIYERKQLKKGNISKLLTNNELREYVLEHLEIGW